MVQVEVADTGVRRTGDGDQLPAGPAGGVNIGQIDVTARLSFHRHD